MPKAFRPVDISQARLSAYEDRPTKVDTDSFARVGRGSMTVSELLNTMPRLQKAVELRAVIDAIVSAYREGKPVVCGLGGHVMKCGLSPLIIRLMEHGVITAVAMNGGASIHDVELGLTGRTSEDVGAGLAEGMFGMVRETSAFMGAALDEGLQAGLGMGEALGRRLESSAAPFKMFSLLAAGSRLDIPVTVHVTIGAETIHMHPGIDGAALGATSMTDFRLLTAVLTQLAGGVYLNIGSAVVLPEVFLKALNLARNLSAAPIDGFTTVNLDMIQHYRPVENVLRRPTRGSGHAYSLTGHHEIMLPLLVQLILEQLVTEPT